MEAFAPQKLANASNQGFFFKLRNQLLSIHLHNIGSVSTFFKQADNINSENMLQEFQIL